MTLTVGSIYRGFTPALQQRSKGMIPDKCGIPRLLLALEELSDLFLRDRAFFDELPLGLGDVYGTCAYAFAVAPIKNQVYTPIHDTKDFDAAAAGRQARYVRARSDDRLIETVDQLVRQFASRLPDRQPPSISGRS